MLGLFIVVTKVKQRILVLPNTAGKKELYGSNTCLGLWLCDFVRFFRIFGCSLISHELLDKTYVYAHHQNQLNEGIKMMCFICRIGVYFSRNHRKCSQNGEDGNLKI